MEIVISKNTRILKYKSFFSKFLQRKQQVELLLEILAMLQEFFSVLENKGVELLDEIKTLRSSSKFGYTYLQ